MGKDIHIWVTFHGALSRIALPPRTSAGTQGEPTVSGLLRGGLVKGTHRPSHQIESLPPVAAACRNIRLHG